MTSSGSLVRSWERGLDVAERLEAVMRVLGNLFSP